MLVNQKNRKLVLNLRDPTRILNTLPTARTLKYKGETLTVVPHRSMEVRVLKNMGFSPPSPVDYYYDWPIKQGWSPLAHQKVTTKFLVENPFSYCLNDMGTMKTLSALWAYDYLRAEGAVRKMLVVSPLSTIERAWADEIFFNLPHLRFAVLHGSKQRRLDLLSTDVDVYIINHDGVKVILNALVSKSDIDVVLIDELAQAARNARTERWRAYKSLTNKRKVIWGMTGTPTPNEPTDAWAQCRLITPTTVPPYAATFKRMVMYQASQFRWSPKDNAMQTVYDAMQPAIRYKRDDCIDLPPVTYETRHAAMTKEQTAMFKEMTAELRIQLRGKEITAVNEAVKTMKLVQVACGAVYGADGDSIVTPPKHRLIALKEVIDEAASKVIVFVPFRKSLDIVNDLLSKEYTTGLIHGGVGKADRDRVFSGFQSGKDPQIIVAQPAAMSHGLTLTSASVIVWFAPIASAETYEQANARITRPGQKLNQFIIHLEGTYLERAMYARLKRKTTMQGVLLDMFRND